MMTIQSIFKDFLKCLLVPKLREVGLSGSGQQYSIKSSSYWSLLGIQKSRSSTSTELKFTMNIFVVKKDEWDNLRAERTFLPPKPSANTIYGIGWSQRIGYLLENESDFWWTIDSETNLNQLASEITNSIVTKVIPIMNEKMADTV